MKKITLGMAVLLTGWGAILLAHPWAINLHPEAPDCGYDINKAKAAFAYIADLGAKYVRTDICWYDLEPGNNSWDASKINFYRDYIDAANAKGLQVLPILYRAPSWALTMYYTNTAQFWIEWKQYCAKVAELYGAKLYYYQLWNEANNNFDYIAASDDYKMFVYARQAIAAKDASFKTMVNVWCNNFPPDDWETTMVGWLRQAGSSIDIIGVDHYPGSWTTTPYTDWYPLDRLIYRISTPGDPCYGKDGAILETGFSTYTWLWHTDADQKNFINQALPVIRQKISAFNNTHSNKIMLSNWCELVDANTGIPLYPDNHFGILTSSWQKKAGYSDFKYQIGLFNSVKSGAEGANNDQQPSLTSAIQYLSCAPNPFKQLTTINYQLAAPANVSLKVYNSNGQLVKNLVTGTKSAGYHSVKWDGNDESGSKVAAGVYLYRMEAGDYSKTNKLTVLK